MKPKNDDQNLKPERIQGTEKVTPERLQEEQGQIGDWQVDPTPNAITRHFAQPSFSASATFVSQVAMQVETNGRVPFVVIDATGVTVRLGNPPRSGVTETDLEMAAALNAIS